MRSVTECPELFVHVALGRYIRSPAQLNQIKSEAEKQRALYRVLKELCGRTKQQSAAKNFFRKNEVNSCCEELPFCKAQLVADLFRCRVEQELEEICRLKASWHFWQEEVEEWKVTDFQGDLTRKVRSVPSLLLTSEPRRS